MSATTTSQLHQRVVEKHYSPKELSYLMGFSARYWCDACKAGELTLRDANAPDLVLAQPVEIGGELRIPASCVNAYLARHPFRYDAGVKARNTGELRRILAKLGH